MHYALKDFYTAHAGRFHDLTITASDGLLVCEYESEDGSFEVFGHVFGQDDIISFQWDDGVSTQSDDPFEAMVQAFALVVAIDDDALVIYEAPAKPGTFGALVWTRRLNDVIGSAEKIATQCRDEIARLNPTTITDLPLFTG